jgi:transglutaminase-like putative cysteine protease
MRFQIQHVTSFHYSQPVFPEPLTVRLTPRTDFRQRLLHFALDIEPTPRKVCEALDLENNLIHHATFPGMTDALSLRVEFTAETDEIDPFDFVLLSEAVRLPMRPPAGFHAPFQPYLGCTDTPRTVAELAERLAAEVDYQTVPFVARLNSWIFNQHEKIERPQGSPWPAAETLSRGCGSCRDLAVLELECCRALGIPSRFVSGYSAAGKDGAEDQQLHAWAEVYLPGAGWRGFDPALGLAINERHLAVAASVEVTTAAPTSGTYRGTADSRLETSIRFIEPAPPMHAIDV